MYGFYITYSVYEYGFLLLIGAETILKVFVSLVV